MRSNSKSKADLISEIDRLIKNKPAIYDRCDLLSIINKIEKLIDEYRTSSENILE
jgi:hypothetical protein